MQLGEVCLLTADVPRLAAFYRWLMDVPQSCDDTVHQTVLATEPMLTVHHDGTHLCNVPQRICIALTVQNVDEHYARLLQAGVPILTPPTDRPWGARNLCFTDPDGNQVYLRSYLPSQGDPTNTTP